MSYDENKQMVLEIIYSMDTIINLRSSEFQNYFNNLYNSIYEKKDSFSNTTEMNKYLLNDCYQYINKKTSQLKNIKPTYNTSPQFQKQSTTIETIDINDIRHKKDDKFSLKLKSKQEEFDTLITNTVPDEIDFSDKVDESSQNLDILMNQSLADREKELRFITNKYNEKKTSDFLKPKDTRSDNKKAKDDDRNKNKNKNKNKKVTFNIQETPKNELSNDVSAFLSKLKTTEFNDMNDMNDMNNMNDMNDMNDMNNMNDIDDIGKSEDIKNILTNIEKILSNQEKILELLKKD
jgi:hypothetical protein